MNGEDRTGALDQTSQTLSRQWKQGRGVEKRLKSKSPTRHPLTIAVSREAGAEGAAIGAAVGTRLDWPVYDDALLERIAQDLGVQKNLLESVDEKRMGWLEEAFTAFMAVPFVSEGAYVQHLVKTILALGARGECVIVGRAAAFILPADSTLRVRLIAPAEVRLAAIREQLGVSEVEVSRQLEAIDRERSRFVEDHFFKDPSDLRNFDIVLNDARFGVDRCAQVITEAARLLQQLPVVKA